MKRIVSFFLMIFLLISPVLTVKAENTGVHQRVINVVYDDSGSMIQMSGEKYDTWCQAKYSMEVFASMLGPEDTMNIYVMSDYMTGTENPPRLVLYGKDGGEKNVKSVHDMLTKAQDTPFRSVKKAYEDLAKTTADDKWLVVLTDGQFDEYMDQADGGKAELDKFFAGKAADVKVMFFGMGKKAAQISQNADKNIFFEKAQNNNEILNKITGICTRIFNSHRLDVSVSSKKIEFDVPMAQLIVFAQGEKVEIGNLKGESGDKIKSSNIVSVRYCEQAATNPSYQDPLVATNLVGKVATFNGDYDAGSYTIDVSGAETIEVYYKPNVTIAAYLKNLDGEEVTNMEDLESGEYIIEFGFVRVGTNEIVPESKLLGDVDYSATVTNNGVKHDKTYSSGDKIFLEEGELKVDATAYFLDYNTVSATLDYNIYKHKQILFTVEEEKIYEVTSDGITGDPTVLRLTFDEGDFSAEQWAKLTVPEITLGDKLPEKDPGFMKNFNFIRKFNTINEVKVEKGEEPGVLYLYPMLKGDKPKTGTYLGRKYSISAYTEDGKAVWKGEMEGELQVTDSRNFLEQYIDIVIRILIFLFIIFIILGYTLFKKRFPKSMKGTPTIECKPLPFGRTETTLGRFTKDNMSVILPFVPEKGTLTFVPMGTAGVPSMSLKAAGGSRMIVLNTSSFAGNKLVSIDGESIPTGQTKPLNKTSSMTIEVKTQIMKYTCTPRM